MNQNSHKAYKLTECLPNYTIYSFSLKLIARNSHKPTKLSHDTLGIRKLCIGLARKPGRGGTPGWKKFAPR